MITTELYNGQGLGNQLWCYAVTRAIALRHGYEFGIGHSEKFKGAEFLNLDFGKEVVGGTGPEGGPAITLPIGINQYYRERGMFHPKTGADIRLHDDSLINIGDNTKIDGVMQDESYIAPYKEAIKKWFTICPEHDCRDYSKENICVINFRGGEYARHTELLLTKKYWGQAIEHMRTIRSDMTFVVITDDPNTARAFFPNIPVFHFTIGKDYAIIHRAYYLILSNSSFAWFPAWLSEDLKYCIAPMYWARHNVSDGYWSPGYAITKGWLYQSPDGTLHTYDEVTTAFEIYKKDHPHYFIARPEPTTSLLKKILKKLLS